MNASLFHVATALNANARWQELITHPRVVNRDVGAHLLQHGAELVNSSDAVSRGLRPRGIINARPERPIL